MTDYFAQITEDKPQADYFEDLKVTKERGLPEEIPEGMDYFDVIGYVEPEPPKAERLAEPDFLERNWPFGSTSDPEARAAAAAETTDEELTMEEKTAGLEEPWIDPTTVGFSAAGLGGRLARKAGAKGLEVLGRAAVSGAVGAAAEYPIGMATEVVGEKYPGLALPFNIAVGMLSGATVEALIEKRVAKALAKGASKKVVKTNIVKVKKALEAEDYSDPLVKNVADDINARLRVDAEVKSAEEAAEAFKGADYLDEIVPSKAAEKAAPKIIPGDVQAGGLAYGQELPKYASSINLERVGADYDTKKMILDVSDRYKGTIDAAKRGKITHETTRELADNLGMTEKQLLKRRKGRAFNAEEALAARDILNTSAQNMVELQKRVALDPTEENLALFKMAMDRHAAVQAEVTGVATEAGRALSAHRIQSAKNARVAKNYEKMLDILGGKDTSDKLLRYFSTIDPNDQTAVNKFIMETSEAKTGDKIYEAWINGLLSGPQTHVVNTTSNALTFLSNIPERGTAATLDLLRASATRTPRERYYGELPEHIYGAWHGMKEGVQAGLKAFMTEIPTEGVSKLEIPRQMAIKGTKGRMVRLPGRALMAMDEFFKAVNYRAELQSLAFRQAAKEGKKGKLRAERIAEIVSSPSDELKGKATEEMLYRVFQKELGPSGKALTKLRTKTPGLKWIIPFLRTPVNIVKFGVERTPLSLARYPGMFKKLMKGDMNIPEITDEMAKTLMGSMVGMYVFMSAKEGKVTGAGPKNKADREALYRTGWQPYSFKIGSKYYSYGRLEPLGMVVGTAADAAEIWDQMGQEDQENVAALIGGAVAQNFTNKTFMKGLGEAMNAMSDPARYGERWVQNFAGTVVPSLGAATARAIDPGLKEVHTILDKIRSRIPGMTDTVFPKRDIWGSPIKRDVSGPAAMVTPVYVSEEKGSKADKEIARLGVRISKLSKKIRDVELTPKQYDTLMKEAGKEAKQRVDGFVNQKSYDKMKDEIKGKMIERRYRGAVERVRSKMWHEELKGAIQ